MMEKGLVVITKRGARMVRILYSSTIRLPINPKYEKLLGEEYLTFGQPYQLEEHSRPDAPWSGGRGFAYSRIVPRWNDSRMFRGSFL